MLHVIDTIRQARRADGDALSRLVALAQRRRSRGPALVAQRGNAVIAMIALTNGAILADPLQANDDAVRLLKCRRYQLLRQGGSVARARSLLGRKASLPAA
jgi:hypothetical protein